MENFFKRLERDYPDLYKQMQEGLNNPTKKELTEAAVKQIMAEEAALNEPKVKAQGLKEFAHPCKGTCSGWQQGFEAGQKSKAATLKLPEKKNNKLKGCDCNGCHYMQGWDAALDEVVRINEGEIETTQAEKSNKLTESQIEHILHVLHNEIQFYNVNGEHDNNNVLKNIETALRTKWDDPLL